MSRTLILAIRTVNTGFGCGINDLDSSVIAYHNVTFRTVFPHCVLDAALYEGTAKVSEAIAFIAELTAAMTLQRTIVVDVGFVAHRGWAVIEFNAAWGAGLNSCDPEKIISASLAASSPSTS
jgi:hypothetical protein